MNIWNFQSKILNLCFNKMNTWNLEVNLIIIINNIESY